MERTSNNTITLLDIDSEGITDASGGKSIPSIELGYFVHDCHVGVSVVSEEEAEIRQIGVHDTASLQALLSELESAGCQLWKRVIVGGDISKMEIELGWEQATATDFVSVINDWTGSRDNVGFFKVKDDELVEAVKQVYDIHNDMVVITQVLYPLGTTFLKITANEPKAILKMYDAHDVGGDQTDVITFSLTLGDGAVFEASNLKVTTSQNFINFSYTT